MDKKSKIDTLKKKIILLLANFAEIDMVKLKKKNRELGVLTSGIKRDGHQKKPGIRKSGNQKFRELGWTTVPLTESVSLFRKKEDSDPNKIDL